jgi:hypothetical protein
LQKGEPRARSVICQSLRPMMRARAMSQMMKPVIAASPASTIVRLIDGGSRLIAVAASGA